MNIITDHELADGKRKAFAIGALIATAVSALAFRWSYMPAVPVGAPEILLQTPSQTVARIPTRHGEKRVDCTVTIDQVKNIWSITC